MSQNGDGDALLEYYQSELRYLRDMGGSFAHAYPRVASRLELGPDDNVLVITSAGCNALDYALAGPRHVYAVDLNPRQNALLELKKAAIRALPGAQRPRRNWRRFALLNR